jgi:hypothetical protein
LAEPFFSTRSRRRGFGLATVYGTLTAHRGGFELRPGPGRGVEVRLLVPVAAAAPEPATAAAAAHGAAGGAKVLVVDNDDKMRALVSRVLEQAGFRVQAVASGSAALETYAAAANDPFGVVVSDVVMPGINGVELAHRLLHHDPDVRVLFMPRPFLDLVPTLRVGTKLGRSASRLRSGRDAERPQIGSHAPRGSQHYLPLCCLMSESICFFTASRLNEAGSCIGG